MLRASPRRALATSFVLSVALTGACHSGDDDHAENGGAPSSGGAPATGGSATATGGSATGGSAGTTSTIGGSAGTTSSGGSGGNAMGGASTGGSAGTSNNTGGFAAVSANPCDTALFCDDFESYSSAPNGKWSLLTKSGAVAIDTTQHFSGTQSVKFTTQSASSAQAFMRIQDTSIFPVPNDVLYGRMMFRIESEPTQSVHWTMIAGLGLVPGQTYHSEYRYGGQYPVTGGSQLMASYETPDWYSDKTTPGSDCWHHSNARVIPAATWTCVEWEFDGASNGMQMWLNGTLADDLTIMGHGDGCVNNATDYTWTAPTFSSIDLGWESYQQDDARTAYIDDVVLSTTRIGCP